MFTHHDTEARTAARPATRKNRFLAVTAAALLLATGALPATAASAAAPGHVSLTPGEVDFLTSEWTHFGVSESVQASLIEKIESGAPLDALTSTAPLSTETVNNVTTVDTVSTFADGSISAYSVEVPSVAAKGEYSPQSVSGCSGGGTAQIYTNCKVRGIFGAVSLQFTAGYTLSSAGNARINSYDTKDVKGIGVTVDAGTFELVRRNQSGSSPARVDLSTQWAIGGAVGGTARLTLSVLNLQAYSN
jgi:hypothetical protein